MVISAVRMPKDIGTRLHEVEIATQAQRDPLKDWDRTIRVD
jgi:hypothetical protein